MATSSPLNTTDAIRAIKDQHCQQCGSQARGFIYRKMLPIYYCRECLRHELATSNPVCPTSIVDSRMQHQRSQHLYR